MRTLYIAPVALAALSASAIAAELPARALSPEPVHAAPIFTWTGAYVGAQLGWQYQRDQWLNYGPYRSLSYPAQRETGLIGGMHAGYNHQIGALVLGVQADVEFAEFKPKYQEMWNGQPFGYNAKIGPQGSLRARVGYAIDKTLIYVTAGFVLTDLTQNFYDKRIIQPFSINNSELKAGLTVGAGVEYALTSDWSAFIDYRHVKLGKLRYPAITYDNTYRDVYMEYSRLTSNSVRLGFAYKLGGSEIVAAK